VLTALGLAAATVALLPVAMVRNTRLGGAGAELNFINFTRTNNGCGMTTRHTPPPPPRNSRACRLNEASLNKQAVPFPQPPETAVPLSTVGRLPPTGKYAFRTESGRQARLKPAPTVKLPHHAGQNPALAAGVPCCAHLKPTFTVTAKLHGQARLIQYITAPIQKRVIILRKK
jgi:hypothetical protein